MIAFVRGTVAALTMDSAVVEVGGVGIAVMCTPGTLAGLRVGAETRLATSMVVREDSLTLFGFVDDDERGLFELLQTASGVGPKLAQAMLAVHGPDELRRAIASNDLTTLCRVPGIGTKGAQRIVLELKDRIGPVSTVVPPTKRAAAGDGEAGWQPAVQGALLNLGWSMRETEAALEAVRPVAEEAALDGRALTTPELLRLALRSLSRA